jgi:hypothetical protein
MTSAENRDLRCSDGSQGDEIADRLASAHVASTVTLAREKHHINRHSALGGKLKQDGKHKIHTLGKTGVYPEVKNGKLAGRNLQVKKSRPAASSPLRTSV